MLVLGRRLGEKIYIGDDITITVVGIETGKVRIGILAPKETRIFREEIAPARKAEVVVAPIGDPA